MWNPMRRTEATGGLVDIIHQVRRRWRYKLALRGAVGVLGLGVAALLLSAYGLESWRFSARLDHHVPGRRSDWRSLRLIGWFLVRPLLRRVSDEQVALYLEEHEPSLQAAIISAVEASALAEHGTESPHSAALVRRLVQSAVEKCQAIDRGRRVERRPLRRYAGSLAAIAVAALARSSRSGPATCGTRCRRCSIVSRSVEAAAPYRIEVTPGNATVPRGADQTITAKLDGFDVRAGRR